MSLFRKKSLNSLLAQAADSEKGLKRTLGAGNLIALAKHDICLHYARYAGVAALLFLAMGILWALTHPSSDPADTSRSVTDVPYVLQPPN